MLPFISIAMVMASPHSKRTLIKTKAKSYPWAAQQKGPHGKKQRSSIPQPQGMWSCQQPHEWIYKWLNLEMTLTRDFAHFVQLRSQCSTVSLSKTHSSQQGHSLSCTVCESWHAFIITVSYASFTALKPTLLSLFIPKPQQPQIHAVNVLPCPE